MRASIERHMGDLDVFSSWEAEAALVLRTGEIFHERMELLTGEAICRNELFLVSNLAPAGEVTFGYVYNGNLICGRFEGVKLTRCWSHKDPLRTVDTIIDLWTDQDLHRDWQPDEAAISLAMVGAGLLTLALIG